MTCRKLIPEIGQDYTYDFEPMETTDMAVIEEIRQNQINLPGIGKIESNDSMILQSRIDSETIQWILPFLNPNSINGQVAMYKVDNTNMMLKVQLRKEADLIYNDYLALERIWGVIKAASKNEYFESALMGKVSTFLFIPIVHHQPIDESYEENGSYVAMDLLRYHNTSLYNVFPAITFQPMETSTTLYNKLTKYFGNDQQQRQLIKAKQIKDIKDIIDLTIGLNNLNKRQPNTNKHRNVGINVATMHAEFIKFIELGEIDFSDTINNLLNQTNTDLENSLKSLLPNYVMDVENNVFSRLNILYKKMLLLGTNLIPGFAHNDLHVTNVLYDETNKEFLVIDFGRSTFGQDDKKYDPLLSDWIKARAECFNTEEKNYVIDNLSARKEFATKKSRGLEDNIWADLAGLSMCMYENYWFNSDIDKWLTDVVKDGKQKKKDERIEFFKNEWNAISGKDGLNDKYCYIKLSLIWCLIYIEQVPKDSKTNYMFSNGVFDGRKYNKYQMVGASLSGLSTTRAPQILNIIYNVETPYKESDLYKSLSNFNTSGGGGLKKNKGKKTQIEECKETWSKIYNDKEQMLRKLMKNKHGLKSRLL